jgi:hypothetical protein
MSLATIDYAVKQNEDWIDSFQIFDATDEGEPGDPRDLTGSSFRAHFRADPDGATVYLEASTDNGRLQVGDDPVEGWVHWNVPRSVLKGVPPGIYHYDVVWTDAGGAVDTVAEGIWTLKIGITR